jgi:hypothetical protein
MANRRRRTTSERGPRPPRRLLALRKRARKHQATKTGAVLQTANAVELLALTKAWKAEKGK